MEGIELISFQIIANVGEAKANFINAIKYAKEKDFDKANKCINDGEEQMIKGHKAHMDVLSKQANGEKLPFDLLLVHAEDQMMSAETIKIMAEELLNYIK